MSIEYRMSPKAMDDFGLMLAAEDDEGAKEIAMEAIERLPDDEDYNLWTLARVEREEDEHLHDAVDMNGMYHEIPVCEVERNTEVGFVRVVETTE